MNIIILGAGTFGTAIANELSFNSGNNVFLADLSVEGVAHFGGEYSNGKYEFNITRYFNNLLNNDAYTNQLYLLASGGAVNANRTIIDNSSIKISILYSDL